MSRSSSNTETNADTAMTDAYHNEGESEEEDNDNYGLDCRSEEETIPVAKPARTRAVQEKKKALKAADAINRHSKNKSVKNVKIQKKAPVTGSQNTQARRTRSSTRSQPVTPQPTSTQTGDESAQPAEKKKIRKTWLPWERALLRDALIAWWHAEGAQRYNHPTKMVLPSQNDVRDWEWIRAKCKALNGSFNRVRGGVYIIAHGMKDDLPPVLGSDDSTAGLRRRR